MKVEDLDHIVKIIPIEVPQNYILCDLTMQTGDREFICRQKFFVEKELLTELSRLDCAIDKDMRRTSSNSWHWMKTPDGINALQLQLAILFRLCPSIKTTIHSALKAKEISSSRLLSLSLREDIPSTFLHYSVDRLTSAQVKKVAKDVDKQKTLAFANEGLFSQKESIRLLSKWVINTMEPELPEIKETNENSSDITD